MILIKNATLIDENGTRNKDVVIQDAFVKSVNDPGSVDEEKMDHVIDADGLILSPGFVDIHTHLREPGREEAETIATGTRAAVKGGYTYVLAMPNTEPAIDCVEVLDSVKRIAEETGVCEVGFTSAITIEREGKQLVQMQEMARHGVKQFTDDGRGLGDNNLMRRALEYCSDLGVMISQHCEDESLSKNGVMNEGALSGQLGLTGVPGEAEETMVARDIALARATGGRVHFQHLSTARSIELVKSAKTEGLKISAEVTPHHFTLTEELVTQFDANFRVNPPLRSRSDVDACITGVKEGVFDAIATDHAPHAENLKQLPFDEAPPGMLGLETAFSLGLTHLDIPIEKLLALFSWKPAKLIGVDRGSGGAQGGPIDEGAFANLTLIDTESTWVVDKNALASKSINCPYHGMQLRGRIVHTIVNGNLIVTDGKLAK